MQPETEPWRSASGFQPPTPSPTSRLRMHSPAAAVALYAPPHYLPPAIPAAISIGAPKTEPQRLGFGILAMNRCPRLRDQTRRPTTAATTYTQPNNLPSSIPAAISIGAPETELQRLGFGPLADNCCPRLRDRTQRPTAAPTTYAQPINLPSSIPAAVFIGTPETEPPRLGFGFLSKIRRACLHERTQCSTTAVTPYPPPHHHLSLIPDTFFISAPETEPLQLDFHIFGPSIRVRARTTRDKRERAREGSPGGMDDGYRGGLHKSGDEHGRA